MGWGFEKQNITESNNINKLLVILTGLLLSLIYIITFCYILLRLNYNLNERLMIIEQQNKTQDSLFNDMYYAVIDTGERKSFIVTVTTYNATKGQCDESPDRTSCNFKIDMNNPFKHRIIGLSRDLLDHFYYGEKVLLQNCGKYSGEYIVADCGNKRLVRTVDILINRNMIGGKFENAVIIKQE